MKRYFAIILFSCCLSLSAAAQEQPPANPDPATKEQVLKMMELIGMKRNTDLLWKGMKNAIKEGIWTSIKRKQPDVPEKMITEMNAVIDEMFNSLKADEMLELMVPIYQKYLTKSEADAAIRFYSSPEGSSLLKKTPAMMNEGMQVGQKYGHDVLEQVMPDLDKRIAEIVKKYAPADDNPEPGKGANK